MGYYSILYSIIIIISLAVILTLSIMSYRANHPNKMNNNLIRVHKIKMGKKCRKKCNKKVCNNYRDRIHDYNFCKKCKKGNKCYSKPQNECINCSKRDLNLKCVSSNSYGCQNPRGYLKPDVPPINPAQTKCIPCWENA